MTFIRITLLWLLVASQSFATTYYVNYETGSDAANGTTTGTPWKHCPGDARATGNALAAVLVGGDTVLFNNASTYTFDLGIVLKWSGTSSARIIYDGQTWGTGTRCLVTNNNGASAYAFNATVFRSNFTIRGFDIREVGGYDENDAIWSGRQCTASAATDIITTASPHGFVNGRQICFQPADPTAAMPGGMIKAGAGTKSRMYVNEVLSPTTFTTKKDGGSGTPAFVDITSDDVGGLLCWPVYASGSSGTLATKGGAGVGLGAGSANVTIENCNFDQIGNWIGKIPVSGTNSVTGVGVSIYDASNLIIKNCDFTKVSNGLTITARVLTENVLIQDCQFHDYMNWLIDVTFRNTTGIMRNIQVDRCKLYNYHQFDSPHWQGLGEKPHQDGFFFRNETAYAGVFDGPFRITNTLFYNEFPSNGGTASVFMSRGGRVDIDNCIFLQDSHANAYVNIGHDAGGQSEYRRDRRVRIRNSTFVGSHRLFRHGGGGGYLRLSTGLISQSGTTITSTHPTEFGEFDEGARVMWTGGIDPGYLTTGMNPAVTTFSTVASTPSIPEAGLGAVTATDSKTVAAAPAWIYSYQKDNNTRVTYLEVVNCAFFRISTFDALTLAPIELPAGYIDYNVYYNQQPSRLFYFEQNSGTGYKNLSQWQAFGHDPNSFVHPTLDGVFRSIEGRTGIWDLTPAVGSPLIGAGVNLWNQEAGLRTDFYGNPRPESGAWDVGAIQFSAPVGTAPTVTITNPATDTVTAPEFTLLTFEAAGVDTEDGVLTVSWRSSRDGELGSGDTIEAILTEGVHTITASVEDSDGRAASDSVTVTITNVPEPEPVVGGGRPGKKDQGRKAVLTQEN